MSSHTYCNFAQHAWSTSTSRKAQSGWHRPVENVSGRLSTVDVSVLTFSSRPYSNHFLSLSSSMWAHFGLFIFSNFLLFCQTQVLLIFPVKHHNYVDNLDSRWLSKKNFFINFFHILSCLLKLSWQFCLVPLQLYRTDPARQFSLGSCVLEIGGSNPTWGKFTW